MDNSSQKAPCRALRSLSPAPSAGDELHALRDNVCACVFDQQVSVIDVTI